MLKQQRFLMIIRVSCTQCYNSCHLGTSADHRSALAARHTSDQMLARRVDVTITHHTMDGLR